VARVERVDEICGAELESTQREVVESGSKAELGRRRIGKRWSQMERLRWKGMVDRRMDVYSDELGI
jgi:hypothetical protein